MNRVFIIMMAIALLSGIVNAAVGIEGGMVGLGVAGVGISMDFENLYLSIRGSYFPMEYGIYFLNLGMGTQTEGLNMGPIVLKGKIGMNLNGIYVGRYFPVESVVFDGVIFGFEGIVECLVRCFDFMYIGIRMGGIFPVLLEPAYWLPWPQGGLVIRFGN